MYIKYPFRSIIIPVLLCIGILYGCNSNQSSQDRNIVAQLDTDTFIYFSELKNYHAGRFFERRYPEAELKAYPIALQELITTRLKLIDFFKSGFDKDSDLMRDMPRAINEEILLIYLEDKILEDIIAKHGDVGPRLEIVNKYADDAYEEFEAQKIAQVDESSITWNDAGVAQITEWANIKDFFTGGYKHIIETALKEGNNFTILEYPGGVVDLAHYLKLLDNILILQDNTQPTSSVVKDFILEAVRTELLLQKALQFGAGDKVLSPNTSSAYLKDRYMRLYNQKTIFNKMPEATEENYLAFYEDQKDASLYQLAKRIIYVASFKNRIEAEQLKSAIDGGQSFEAATKSRWSNKSFIINREGVLESYLSVEEPYLGEAAFALSEGEVSEIITYQDPEDNTTRYAIIKCVTALEEKIPDFNEVENIDRKFTEFYRQQLTGQVEEELWAKYPVQIFEKNIEYQLSRK